MDELNNGNGHSALKALSEQFQKIGWNEQLVHLTQDEALAIISAIQSVSGDNNGVLDLNPKSISPDDEIPF